MPVRKTKLATATLALALAVFGLGTGSGFCQQIPGPAGSLWSVLPPPRPVLQFLERGLPGLTNPSSPVVFPPTFQARTRVRPLYIFVSGNVEERVSGNTVDLVDDLGMVPEGIVVETTVRAQFSRLALRVSYDAYVRSFESARARLEWPCFHGGLDFDVLDAGGLNMGLNMDFYRDRPVFNFSGSAIGGALIMGGRPVTAGLHIDYNPTNVGGMSLSFQARGRWPLRRSVKISEFEVSAGLRSPVTMLGSGAARIGWRYSKLELSNAAYQVSIDWSAVFGELVYYY